tara:strand:+ start:1281 stop:2816 length:1536 start_codon:yes stop_codon:yes gene_type:complete
MAYQNVGGTPRFYIDSFQYLKSLGFNIVVVENQEVNEELLNLLDLDPVIQKKLNNHINIKWSDIPFDGTYYADENHPYPSWSLKNFVNPEKAYFALLNHNIKSEGDQFTATCYFADPNSIATTFSNRQEILNATDLGGDSNPILTSEKGCTIMGGDISNYDIYDSVTSTVKLQVFEGSENLHVGAFSVGSYYDMPVSPNLNLTMNIEFDGFDNSKALNGATSTNAIYQGSPWWYDKDGNKVEPWAIGGLKAISKRNGRRVWNLNFSYVSDKDLFASNYGSSTYAEPGNLTDIGYDSGDVDTMNWGQDLITNGDFEDGLTGWGAGSDSANGGVTPVIRNTGSPASNGARIVTVGENNGNSYINQNYTIKSGDTFKISYRILENNGGSVAFESNTTVHLESSVGNHSFEYTFPADDSGFVFKRGQKDTDVTIDDIVVLKSNPSDFQYTIDDDDSFSAQVLNKISHGQKFIFQPDNTNNNPDQFAICVLDQNSFSMKRTAHNVYDISMKIKEVW